MNLFQHDLKNFLDAVLPKTASLVQRKEMAKAFISGSKITAHRLDVDGIVNYKKHVDKAFDEIIQA